MRTLKLFQNSLLSMALTSFFGLGVYNAMIVNSDAFMNEVHDIKFVKRLDEIHGKVQFGRIAASDSEWQDLGSSKPAVKTVRPLKNKTATLLKKKVDPLKKKVEKTLDLPPPAISSDLELNVTNVFFKGPLDPAKVSGSMRVFNGYIEELTVVLPDGSVIDIQTKERMVGNVFQYEDLETREIKSGMFYEVKNGTYMLNLTSDSLYPGLRVELKSNNDEQFANNDPLYENVNFNGAKEVIN